MGLAPPLSGPGRARKAGSMGCGYGQKFSSPGRAEGDKASLIGDAAVDASKSELPLQYKSSVLPVAAIASGKGGEGGKEGAS